MDNNSFNRESASADDPKSNYSPPGQSGAAKPRGKPFERGNHEGKGRPKGSRNRKNILWDEETEKYKRPIMIKLLSDAAKGKPAAQKLVVERTVPITQDNYMDLTLPPLQTIADVHSASEEIILATAAGEVSAEHGRLLLSMLQDHRRMLEASDFDRRLAALEQEKADGGKSGLFEVQQPAEPVVNDGEPVVSEEGTHAS